MSNPDKHKPLSAEELFKLLDVNSNKASDFDALDDFEKEALEGFSAHSTPEQAKALTEELNTAISKKVTGDKGATKNKVIWFGAAASIVAIIMVSVFFFYQTKQDSQTNIVLNDTKEMPKPIPESITPIEASAENASGKKQEAPLLEETVSQAENRKDAESEYKERLAKETTIAFSENKPKQEVASNRLSVVKDESKARNENDNDAFLDQKISLADKAQDKEREEKNNVIPEQQVTGALSANQNVTATANTTRANEEPAYKYKADTNKNLESKKSAETAKLKKEKVAGEKQADDLANGDVVTYSTSSPVPGSVAANNSRAYYEGGEVALRDFVKSYIKEKQITTPIIGKYKIIGVVGIDGKLKVSSITQISKEYCGSTENIKNALNTTKWVVPGNDGDNILADVEFVIGF